MEVDRSDLVKIDDALRAALSYFEKRDESNSFIHLGDVRYSPITSRLQAAQARLTQLLGIRTSED